MGLSFGSPVFYSYLRSDYELHHYDIAMVSGVRKGIALARDEGCLRYLAVGNHLATDAHRAGTSLLGTVHEAMVNGGRLGASLGR